MFVKILAIHEALEEDEERNKRIWVHPLNLKRCYLGQFHRLYLEYRCYPDKFKKHYRMSVKSFDELLSLIRTKVYKKDTNCRRAIEPEERLAVTLR